MPRSARTVLAGLSLHVVQRGINRQQCFFSDSDYSTCLRFLGEFAVRFGCSLHAYCLMTNHVHLLLTPEAKESCALLMKNLGQRYVQVVNKKLGRTGTLWEGRFKSCLVGTEAYALACYRYIELNPVRAGIVDAPGKYRWSSYPANAEGRGSSLVEAHPAYHALGLNSDQRLFAYRSLCESAPPDPIVEEIRKATRIGCMAGKAREQRGRPWDGRRKMGSVPI
jgi:putative transposase